MSADLDVAKPPKEYKLADCYFKDKCDPFGTTHVLEKFKELEMRHSLLLVSLARRRGDVIVSDGWEVMRQRGIYVSDETVNRLRRDLEFVDVGLKPD